ncbi:MAG: hypothetical protein J7503_17350 [Cellulomonas iranensis]|nr:hypothetical protein [Cellulomonas iranensis]MBO9570569.1 hypothetical protein [Cellulomonas iranensis]
MVVARQGGRLYRFGRGLRRHWQAAAVASLVQLTVDDGDETRALMDMLLAKKRAGDRKAWLETKGDLASLEV